MPGFPDPRRAARLADDVVALRCAAERDIPEVLIAHQDDPELARALGLARPPSGAELGRRVEGEADARAEGIGVWLTVLDRTGGATDDECVGQLEVDDVEPEHGRAALRIWIAPHARGRGLGRAALDLAAGWLLAECGLRRVALLPDAGNLALSRAATAAGFRPEGTLRARRLRADGRRVDVDVLARLAEDDPGRAA